MTVTERYQQTIVLPRAVQFPVEMLRPEGFEEDRLETWPKVTGRLECVEGRLLYMPPCEDLQQDTVTDVVVALGAWSREHRDFVLGTNEAGMRLNDATRAADAAIWRRADLGAYTDGVRRVPPVLAVEVAGEDEPEPMLMRKASWYLDAGVEVVWIVLPESRELVVVDAAGQTRLTTAAASPQHASLPGLALRVADLFVQIS
ncbi:MAG TPA: Uma2 family endonuclease [Candidatus Binatia bacterium]|nr:Uma2 family endonuclease [Candidatus Binatia bacterium]